MTINPETGYAKNLVNFEKLLVAVKAFESSYNPSNPTLTVSAMESLLAQASESLLAFNNAQSAYSSTVDIRQQAFKLYRSFITRINCALKVSGCSKPVYLSAQTIYRKLHGRRASAKLTEQEKQALAAEGKIVNQISVSQMSHSSQLDNFDRYITFLSSIPEYNPNEVEFKVESLRAMLTDLRAKDLAVTTSLTLLQLARTNRNNLIRDNSNSVINVAANVKSYIKSIFGTTSPEYKQIAKIYFR